MRIPPPPPPSTTLPSSSSSTLFFRLLHPGPAQYLAGGLSQQPFFIAFRELIRAPDTEQRLGVGMMVRGHGVIAGPHQPVNAKRVDHPRQLADQVAKRKGLARQARRMPPFDRGVGIPGVSN